MKQIKRAALKDRGNILFLILLAVVLFAALSYAVTQGMRGGGKNATPEKAKTLAASLIQYGALMENTMMRSRIANNIPDWGWDFYDDTGPSQSSANNTCTSSACRLFSTPSRGPGLMTSQKFGEEYIDPRWRTLTPDWGDGVGMDNHFSVAPIVDVGTSEPELLFRVLGLSPEVCSAINELLWNAPGINAEDSPASFYSSTLTAMPAYAVTIGDTNTFFRGKNAACITREHIGDPYGGIFYQVLIAR